ncbi:hypothetical protein P8452_48895 [Trifolium repens]|nr:hypothetical protein P8452_48895 [Trifolium repens]
MESKKQKWFEASSPILYQKQKPNSIQLLSITVLCGLSHSRISILRLHQRFTSRHTQCVNGEASRRIFCFCSSQLFCVVVCFGYSAFYLWFLAR